MSMAWQKIVGSFLIFIKMLCGTISVGSPSCAEKQTRRHSLRSWKVVLMTSPQRERFKLFSDRRSGATFETWLLLFYLKMTWIFNFALTSMLLLHMWHEPLFWSMRCFNNWGWWWWSSSFGSMTLPTTFGTIYIISFLWQQLQQWDVCFAYRSKGAVYRDADIESVDFSTET